MCADSCCLALRLEGPLQAWGTVSQYNRRLTSLLPSKSGVAGMICAALGLDRGSAEEKEILHGIATVRMLALAVPRIGADGRPLSVRRLEDFHTIQNTARAGGGIKDCHITQRHYLQDAAFRVFLEGDRPLLERAGAALQDPVWGLWLGRKSCIPSAPIFIGLFSDTAAALDACLPDRSLTTLLCQDTASFDEGSDSLPDVALSFASSARSFSLRRVTMRKGGDHAS